MAGIARNQGFEAIIIGGVKDHVRALLLLPPALPLSKAIQFLKRKLVEMAERNRGRRQ